MRRRSLRRVERYWTDQIRYIYWGARRSRASGCEGVDQRGGWIETISLIDSGSSGCWVSVASAS